MPQQTTENVMSYGLGSFIPASDLKPEVGDLVEIDRTLYAHWGLYVGDGNIVHVVGSDDEDIPTDLAFVRLQNLNCVARCNGVRINNKDVRAKERGLVSLSVDKIQENVRSVLNCQVPYNLLHMNNEYYVTEWKYGVGWSDQASVALSVMKPLAKDLEVGHNTLLHSLQAVLGTPVGPAVTRITSRSPTPSQKHAQGLA